MERINHWIGGALAPTDSGRSGPVFDPATGTQQAAVDLGSVADVGHAVAVAVLAAEAWRESSLAQRTRVLFAMRELVAGHADELAAAITSQHGKVLSDAAGEVARGLECIEYACGLGEHLKGAFSDQVSTGIDVHTVRRPLGVVAGITPFNFPAMVPLWMCPNAIACGNAFILKPSEKDPGAAMILARLWSEAGLPDGIFNVVHGDKVVVDALLTHPDIAAVSFVGSTPIARYVMETGTPHHKRVQALGGAKNHMVVLPDADLDLAADAAVSAAFGSAGERCMAVSVLVPVGDIADDLVDAITKRCAELTIGPGTDSTSEMGPLVTGEHRDKVAGYVAGAPGEGARVVIDGTEDTFDSDGFFLGVSVIDKVTPEMSCYRDEIFGPVLSVVRAPDAQAAIGLINSNPYGNGVALFTRDGGAARSFARQVTVGMVGINVPIPVPVSTHSFGGWKASLFGDRHIYGPEGIDFYTRSQAITTRWPDPGTSKVDLGFPQLH